MMTIVFAAYTPSLERMIPALLIQLAILGALAGALIAYNCQHTTLLRSMLAVLGPGLVGVLCIFGLAVLAGGMGTEFLVGFFELYFFVIVGSCGMVVGGLALAVASATTPTASQPGPTKGDTESSPP